MPSWTSYPEQAETIEAAERFARSVHECDRTGHDWWHVHRVARMVERLAREEGADAFVCVVAALLHDVADEKLNPSKEEGLRKVGDWLAGRPQMTEDERLHVMDIISTMSYNGGGNPPMRTPEGRVVQDADRLDAIGAIAIARTFVYAGWKGDPLHDPRIPPREKMTAAEYRQDKSTAINHFHEKLLKLKDRINTGSARRIAEERHRYMEAYLAQFGLEWEGEA
ncbi:HD domain-containing protein [Cohnella nanjingensis]|uniref:HD domain-containing protein n=2 Tax=Cohnella nanjingensis TaxID=1387779 RepID=A0A7X0RMY6_9BACL|nr:HD domain-containing protein [Cohnella nanjingensis]